jgi:hypothetical protein
MKRAIALAAIVLFTAAGAAAFITGPEKGNSIAVVDCDALLGGEHGAVGRLMPEYLVEELARAGYAARMERRSMVELSRLPAGGTLDDYYVELVRADAVGMPFGGAVVGGRSAVAAVAIFGARAEAEVRLYHARSLQEVGRFTVDASRTQPALTGLGVGDPWGFAAVSLPLFDALPYRTVAREMAREVAGRLGGRSDQREKRR